jgi:hypothetical protein
VPHLLRVLRQLRLVAGLLGLQCSRTVCAARAARFFLALVDRPHDPPLASPPHPSTPNRYPTLATVLLGGGLCASAGFFLYEASVTRHTRKVSQELLLGGSASVLLGLGVLFLLLWTGVYV